MSRTAPWRAIVGIVAALAILAPAPASAAPIEDAVAETVLEPADLVAAFDDARLPGLHNIGDPPAITGNAELDERIRAIGEGRGYRRRAEAVETNLVYADGYRLQPDAAVAWEALQAAAAAAGHLLTLTSGYRGAASQAVLFNQRLGSTTDEAIDQTLQTVAVPGYSRHHTGYAIDVRSGGYLLHGFANSPVYAWMSADNWAIAKAFGFLPSYPEGVAAQGPNPEPWEFVYVGATNILCVVHDAESTGDQFCDIEYNAFASDVRWFAEQEITSGCTLDRYCPDETVTRAQAGKFLFRMAKADPVDIDVPFDDVEEGMFYTDAVGWMLAEGITNGKTDNEFAPHDPLTRAEFVTFLWRYAGEPSGGDEDFDDVDSSDYYADAVAWASAMGITNGTSMTEFSPDLTATRGQIAALLHRFSDQSVPG